MQQHTTGAAPAAPSGNETADVERLLFELKKVIVGQDRALERMITCLIAGGHCLLESVPGLAKTLSVETLAAAVGGSFSRVQFTPDLLPADVVGTRIYRASSEAFDVELGPVFANFVLADEINRAPAKVQSALLEVMAERQVTIGGVTHPVPRPFLVLATQNPIESEGVYPLPEAQRDRFLMKVVIDYPSPSEELEIVQRMGTTPPTASQVLSLEQVEALQRAADAVYVDRGVLEYAVNLVLCTRTPENFGLPELRNFIELGASPRASLGLIRAGRALALLRGRSYLTPQDVFDVAPEIMRHRMLLSYEALAQDVDVEQVLNRVLGTVPAPRVSPAGSDPYAADPYRPTDPYHGTTTDAGAWGAPAPAPAVAPAAGSGSWGGGPT
jgi:MoxR-like ATPase